MVQAAAGVGITTNLHSDQPMEFSNRSNTSFTPTYGVPSFQATCLPNIDAASNLFNAYACLILRNSEQEAIQLATGSLNALNHAVIPQQQQHRLPILTRPLQVQVQDSFGSLSSALSASSIQHRTAHPLVSLPPMLLPSAFDGFALPPIRLIDRQYGRAITAVGAASSVTW
jgi:hypothetical protein